MMAHKDTDINIIRLLGPRGPVQPSRIIRRPNGLSCELQRYLHLLGPTPKRTLESFSDLGLSDPEIGQYFEIPDDIVTRLRQVWNIRPEA